MPFGGIGVCGGDLVGGAFAALIREEGVGVVAETRRHGVWVWNWLCCTGMFCVGRDCTVILWVVRD